MLFRLTSALATYQRRINTVFKEYLDKFVIVYLDNLLVYLQILEQHIKDVKKVLTLVREADLQLKLEKYKFHI